MSEQIKDILPLVFSEIAENCANRQRAEYEKWKSRYQRRIANVYKKSADDFTKSVFLSVVVGAICLVSRNKSVEIGA